MADQNAAGRVLSGFPVPALKRHGDSSVGAALRSGSIPPGSALKAVEQSLQRSATGRLRLGDTANAPATIPDVVARMRTPYPPAALRARFPSLRRHFVFEYYP